MLKVEDTTMKLRTWKYYIKEGFKGIGKNGLMSLASIIIVAACAFIVILSLCIATNIDYMLEQIESNVSVVLYMGEKPTDEQVMKLKADIESIDHVKKVNYISAEQALDNYAKKTNQNLKESFKDDNPLPRTMEITLDDIKYQKEFSNKLEELQIKFEEEILNINTDGEGQADAEGQSVQTTAAQAATDTTQAATTAQTTAAEPVTVSATVETSVQSQTQVKVQAPANSEQTTAQATTQAAQSDQSLVKPADGSNLPQKNEAEAPVAVSPNAPEIESQAVTNSADDLAPQITDADYKFQGIEKIQQPRQLTDTLVTIDTVFKLVAIVIIAILCIVAIGIIMNTIKLTVFIRRTEINIMKYIGATDWFIRWPFIIEGIVIGIIGAAIPTVLCWFGYFEIYDVFTANTLLSAIGKLRECNEIFKVIAPVTLGVGVLLGAVGSINSIRKHLNV